MRFSYIGAKIINAEPGTNDQGEPGYTVYYPGYTSWSPKHVFEEAYRRVSTGERELLLMTDGESMIAQISDGDPDDLCGARDGGHHWQASEHMPDAWDCVHCGAERFTDPTIGTEGQP